MKSGTKARNSDIYPSYKIVKKAKEFCYPNKKNITILELVVVHDKVEVLKRFKLLNDCLL